VRLGLVVAGRIVLALDRCVLGAVVGHATNQSRAPSTCFILFLPVFMRECV
jgi:hypothetical protein